MDPRLATPGYFFSLVHALRDDPRTEIRTAWSPSAGRRFSETADLRLFPGLMHLNLPLPGAGRVIDALCARAYARELRRVREEVRIYEHGLVHFNWSFHAPSEIPFIGALRRDRVRVVLTAHNAAPHGHATPSSETVALYRAVDHVVVLTEYVQREIERHAGLAPERISVIPHGDFVDEFDTGDGGPPPIPAFVGHPIAVCLGKIRPYKGVPDLLEAWPLVIEALPAARLVVAGRLYWAARREVKRAVQSLGSLASTVHTEFDFLSGARYGALLDAATVLVQPYRTASQSGNTVHAFGCGVPVICTDVGGLAEMIDEGRTGTVARADDPRSLADAIVRALRANQDGAWADACREVHRERFAWKPIAAAHHDLYARLVGG